MIKKSSTIYLIGLTIILIFIPGLVKFIRDAVAARFATLDLGSGYFKDIFFDSKVFFNFYLFKSLDPPAIVGWSIIGLYVIFAIFRIFDFIKDNRSTYKQTDKYGSHGSSRFATNREIINKFFKDKTGWFLGTLKPKNIFKPGMAGGYLPEQGDLNMQITVVGSPGSYKTTAFVLPNIFHIPYAYKNMDRSADMIITDPKSEVYRHTANYLEQNGYDVYVLDFINLKYGNRLNPINYISHDKELMEIAEGYISSVETSKSEKNIKGDPFWSDAECQLLAALIGYVLHVNKDDKAKQTFSEIAKILSSEDVYKDEYAREFFKVSGVGGTALQCWNNFLMSTDKTRANILIGLATKLKLFAISGISTLTDTTDVPIEMIGQKKDRPIALFIFMPDSDRTYTPVINMLISTILKQLYKTAYKNGNILYSPTYLILEEMANIGRLENIQEMLGTMRGRKIYPMMIWQSLSQLKDRYRGWEDIISMTDTLIFLGINDRFTAEYASSILGRTTIQTFGTSRKESGLFANDVNNISENFTSRPILTPDEIKRFPNNKLILSQRSIHPSILFKTQYRFWKEKERLCMPKALSELPLLQKTGGSFNSYQDEK